MSTSSTITSTSGLSGLASGIDTASIIDQLMTVERQSTTRIQLQEDRLTTKDNGLKDISTKLSAVKAAALAMRAPTLWSDNQTVESSSPTQVDVQRLSGAGSGATSIHVVSLASSSQHTFAFASSAAARTLTITPAGSTTGIDVAVGANGSLDDVVAAINGRSDVAVYAAAVRTNPNDPASARLVLSSRTTGAASDFTLSEGGAQTADVAGTARAGKDATYFLDGATDPASLHTSPTNVVDNAIAGLRLTLKGVTSSDVTINVGAPGPNAAGIKTAVHAFVDAYNTAVNTIRSYTTEKTVPTATSGSDALKGQLFGDSGLTALLANMRTAVSQTLGGNPTSSDELLDLGISTGAIGAGTAASTGTLTIDDAKLDARLAADPQGARQLLGAATGVNGFAQRMETLITGQIGVTDSLDFRGEIDQRRKAAADTQRSLADAMTRNDARLAAKQALLKTQFAAMEAAMQSSQTTSAWLTGQISSLH